MFDGEKCVSSALDFCLKLKGKQQKVRNNTIVEYHLQLHAHNESGFDTWIILNNLTCDKHIVDIIKTGKSIISLRVFNSFTEKK